MVSRPTCLQHRNRLQTIVTSQWKHNEDNYSTNTESYTYLVLIKKYIPSSKWNKTGLKQSSRMRYDIINNSLHESTEDMTLSSDSMRSPWTKSGLVFDWILVNRIHTTKHFLRRYIHRSKSEQDQLNLSCDKYIPNEHATNDFGNAMESLGSGLLSFCTNELQATLAYHLILIVTLPQSKSI
jgi:translation initiation factor 2 beta subunit (eIF-2beta)/eIF-5